MVAEAVLLFVGGVVFFVDDDAAQGRAGREDGGARADQHLRVAGAHRQPLFEAGAVGQCGVMHGDALAQAGGEARGEGLHQANFRDEQQHLAAVRG